MRFAKLRVLGLLTVVAVLAVELVHGQVVGPGGFVLPTLKQQLTDGLLARTPEEQAFIDLVVTRVNSGDLPLNLVQSTFLWARKKRPYPAQFFQRALTIRAKDAGLSL